MAPRFDVVKSLQEALSSSEAIRGSSRARELFGLLSASPAKRKAAGFFAVTPAQQQALGKQGNSASDWKEVWVAKGFDPKRVAGCRFEGPVLLGSFSGSSSIDGISFPTGLYDSTLAFCVVGKNALLRNVRLAARCVIGEEAQLFDVGSVTAGEKNAFANGTELLIAIETGGREVRIFSELTVEGAWVVSASRGNKELLAGYNKQVDAYVEKITAPCNVVERRAKILRTPKVHGVFLGEGAVIDAAALVKNALLLSAEGEESEISHGAIVTSSILQWGCEVTSEAIVDASFLTEHSHVERHGKVTHSLLGPNTGVAEGEVTSALLGPFVGFHHQALLIAALWPEGKGNVGYGANIGSNHTAKAPDQEIWPGEGTFFGLGVNIKFPSDLTESPYTIIASGVSMLPQKVRFPFSLINTPAAAYPGVSPAYMEIMPAWVLSDNIYMVKRNEGKYQKRNKAKRSLFNFEVFRPEIADLMKDARRRLSVRQVKDLYTAKDIEGLGKNFLQEPIRKKAVETYTFYIKYYALSGLKRELSAGGKTDPRALLEKRSVDPRWEHERKTLREEMPGIGVPEALQELARMQEKVAQDVQVSKEKDDNRGAEVIADYAQAHKPASEDSFVKETWAATQKMKEDIKALISRSGKSTKAKPSSLPCG